MGSGTHLHLAILSLPIRSFLIPQSHRWDQIFTRICPLYFGWTGMHKQLEKPKGMESSKEVWPFFHQTIKPQWRSSQAVQPVQHAISNSIRYHISKKVAQNMQSLDNCLHCQPCLFAVKLVPFFPSPASPSWEALDPLTPRKAALAGGSLNAFLAPHFFPRWDDSSLSSPFLAPADLINSNGS